jgi:hypothetical protein
MMRRDAATFCVKNFHQRFISHVSSTRKSEVASQQKIVL